MFPSLPLRRLPWLALAFLAAGCALLLTLRLATATQATAESRPTVGETCFASLGTTTQYASADASAVRAAVAAAAPNSIIKMAGYCPGVVAQDGTTQTVLLTKTLMLAGGYTTTNWVTSYPLTQPTTLDALGGGRVMSIGVAATLQGFTVTNGYISDADGGGIYAVEALTLSQMAVYSNAVFAPNCCIGDGGGAYFRATATLTATTFTSNTAVYGGGASFRATATLTATTFTSNTARYGGGAYFEDTATLTATTFTNNTALLGGGASFWDTATLTATTFTSNTAYVGNGGGAYFGATATLTATTFTSNTSYWEGGGAYFWDTATLTATTFTSNRANYGGGASFRATATLTATTFTSNTAGYNGGGAYFWFAATLTATTFTSNMADYGGGAYFWDTATLTATTFTSNRANYGGGASFRATATLTATTFTSNTSYWEGGGAYFGATATLTATTFTSNTAFLGGGGAYFNGNQPAQLTNLLFARNQANRGAALYIEDAAPLTLLHTTIVSPATANTSAIHVISGTVYLTNTLIASHTVGIERFGGTVVEDYTLFANVPTPYSGTLTSGGHSLTGTANFVNPTQDDYHLGAGSAAIDAGINAGVNSDFEGEQRPYGAGFDIGYDERGAAPMLIALNGPSVGLAGVPYTFTAWVTGSAPLRYGWQAGAEATVTHTAGLSDSFTAAWPAGAQRLTLTVANSVGSVVITRPFTLTTLNETEPNNRCPEAMPLTPGTYRAGQLTARNDYDLYRLDLLETNTALTIALVSPPGSVYELDLYDGECDANGTGFPRHWETPRPNRSPYGTGGEDLENLIYRNGPFTGTFYLAVSNPTTGTNPLPYALLATTAQEPADLPAPVACRTVPAPLPPNSTFTATLAGDTDTKVYSFTVTQPNTQLALTLTSPYSHTFDLLEGACVNPGSDEVRHTHTPLQWNFSATDTAKPIVYFVGPYTGTYTLIVRRDPTRPGSVGGLPFTLTTNLQPLTPPGTRTILLYNSAALTARYGPTRTTNVVNKLTTISGHSGLAPTLLLDVSSDPYISSLYAQWQAAPQDPARAIALSRAIYTYLWARPLDYTALQYLVLIGGDDQIPYRRLPDYTRFPESFYVADTLPLTSPLGAALAQNYYLTDDFYADRSRHTLRGLEAPLPEFGLGRLVETPEDIIDNLEYFLNGSVETSAYEALVVGESFLTDSGEQIAARLMGRLLPPRDLQTLLGNSWTLPALRQKLFAETNQYAALLLHGSHATLQTPQDAVITPLEVLTATATLPGGLYASLACHSGLNIPDDYATRYGMTGAGFASTTDWAQVWLQRQAFWVGQTGFGVGGDTTPFSERLLIFFNEQLTAGGTRYLGPTLRRAKQQYYLSLPISDVRPLDMKILNETILYGLPMQGLQFRPPALEQDAPAPLTLSAPALTGPLWGQSVVYQPQHALTTTQVAYYDYIQQQMVITTGRYYQDRSPGNTENPSGLWQEENYPIQPLFVYSLPQTTRMGVVVESGLYSVETGFNPVWTQLGTSQEDQTLPNFASDARWLRPQLAWVNQLTPVQGRLNNSLALLTGQFRSADAQQRTYTELRVTLYTTDTASSDPTPPTLGTPQLVNNTAIRVPNVSADTYRVLFTYTDGRGVLQSMDMVRQPDGAWVVTLPALGHIEYFIQAVDQVGNVSVLDNQGAYYTLDRRYLPFVRR